MIIVIFFHNSIAESQRRSHSCHSALLETFIVMRLLIALNDELIYMMYIIS